MGVDKYYQFYPPLQEDELEKWDIFISRMVCEFGHFLRETEDSYIINKGEGPSIMKNGMLFRNFSSKISKCSEVESIMDAIADILSEIFPNRVYIESSDNDYADFIYAYNDVRLSLPYTPKVPQTKD